MDRLFVTLRVTLLERSESQVLRGTQFMDGRLPVGGRMHKSMWSVLRAVALPHMSSVGIRSPYLLLVE